VQAQLTADPVWCLKPSALPASFLSLQNRQKWLGNGDKPGDADNAGNGAANKLMIGLSLRESPHIDARFAELLAEALAECAPDATVVPLILQERQDKELIEAFCRAGSQRGLNFERADCASLQRPSQWLSLLSSLDMVVGMRFHALLMALKGGVPCFGLAYDPKVLYLMQKFEQPCLRFDGLKTGQAEADERFKNEMKELINSLIGNAPQLAEKARLQADEAARAACQNFDVLARILEKQEESRQR